MRGPQEAATCICYETLKALIGYLGKLCLHRLRLPVVPWGSLHIRAGDHLRCLTCRVIVSIDEATGGRSGRTAARLIMVEALKVKRRTMPTEDEGGHPPGPR